MCLGAESDSVLRSGADTRQVKREDAGAVLADTLRHFLFELQVEDGLGAVGYSKDDIPALVKGTIPQVCQSTLLPPPQEVQTQSSSDSLVHTLPAEPHQPNSVHLSERLRQVTLWFDSI